MKRAFQAAAEATEEALLSALRPIGMPPEVTVVVPTHRRPQLLARCLAALTRQTVPPHLFEIVVCNDGCDQATRELVADFSYRMRSFGLRVVYVPITGTQGPAGARNRGWRRARAPVIAFTDDDTVPDRAWLEAGLCAMRRGPGAVAGRIRVPLSRRPTDYELDAAGLETSEFATANCFVHRDVLDLVGGFDERYTSAWREDSDLQFAMLCAGATVARADDAMVWHPVRPARWGISVAQQRKSQFDALLHKKYPKLYRTRVARHPPFGYYAIVGSLAVAGVGLASGLPLVTAVGAIGWLYLTGEFLRRRLEGTARTPSHVAEMVVTSLVIPVVSVFWRLYGAARFRTLFL